ncbi:hypothetical protein [Rhodonellum sp.]|uniref:hypothetical protein n=1 Tax=Rhodonellum sp. TaxID=2231180 RepID=UPI00271F3FF3|nr:hypothetical protein [Rhodonellum sp.]MDO9552796.1 hypothetical protein [Rhodonellum sp.]
MKKGKKSLNVLLFGFLFFAMCHQSHAQKIQETLVNHGPQLTASMIQGSLFVEDASGRELVYTVVRGEPAHLLAYEVKTQALVFDVPLPKADGAWDLAESSDGYLYIPGANGSLFQHQIGSDQIKDLGIALPEETYLWNLTAGNEGEIFGATYPGCRVFRYHPDEGFSDVGKGPLVKGENYVRSLAFHKRTGLLYAGIGSHAHLIELNPKTGAKTDILPEAYREKEFVYGLEIVPSASGEDRLFALLTSGNQTLVINLKTKLVEQEIEGMDLKALASSPSGDQVYVSSKARILAFDPKKPFQEAKTILAKAGTANALHWSKAGHLKVLTAGGNLMIVDPVSQKESSAQLDIPGQPIPINAIVAAADGKIWTGGYLAGGHASFDPQTNAVEEFKGLDQTEGMVRSGNEIYMGIYPKGKFYVFDPQQPWVSKEDNPRFLGQIPGQSRGFALGALGNTQKLAFGMIPEYGQLGGALVVYDKQTKDLNTFEQPIPDQGISSLIYHRDVLLVGTTISGGLGIAPTTKEAKIFIWDVLEKKVVYETVPVPGASAITGLMVGPDDNIWGMADGSLFVFDPKNKVTQRVQKLYDFPAFKSHLWRSAFLVLHPNGYVYGTDNKKLFRLDPRSMQVDEIAEDASLLVMDPMGRLYFKRGTELWSFFPQSTNSNLNQ